MWYHRQYHVMLEFLMVSTIIWFAMCLCWDTKYMIIVSARILQSILSIIYTWYWLWYNIYICQYYDVIWIQFNSLRLGFLNSEMLEVCWPLPCARWAAPRDAATSGYILPSREKQSFDFPLQKWIPYAANRQDKGISSTKTEHAPTQCKPGSMQDITPSLLIKT
jgi:hypothetical protein